VDTLVNKSATQIGLRKILCLFLVDPAHRIISTAHVTNSSWSRLASRVQKVLMPLLPSNMPTVLIGLIIGYSAVGMTHREALHVRADLMNERKYFVGAHNALWERSFSLCEH
jgi:hypothetical protein